MNIAVAELRKIKIFSDLPDDELNLVLKDCVVKSYQRDSKVISSGDNHGQVYFILSGQVRFMRYSEQGREVHYGCNDQSEIFGELEAFDNQPCRYDVYTTKESVIGAIKASLLKSLVMSNHSVSDKLLQALSNRMQQHMERIFEFSALTVKQRIRRELLRLGYSQKINSEDGVVVVDKAPTHAEIALRISSHREAVTRELKHLESLGVITWRPGKHMIKDINQLQQLA